MLWVFLWDNRVTILLTLLTAVIIGLAIRFVWRHRHSCGGCAGCPHADSCRHKPSKF